MSIKDSRAYKIGIENLFFLWQLPQHIIALLFYILLFITGHKLQVERWHNYKVVLVGKFSAGVSLGDWIFCPDTMKVDMEDPLFRHEMGHTAQSKLFGIFYLNFIGIPSLISYIVLRSSHDKRWFEQWATILGYQLRYYYSNVEEDKVFQSARIPIFQGFNDSFHFNKTKTMASRYPDLPRYRHVSIHILDIIMFSITSILLLLMILYLVFGI